MDPLLSHYSVRAEYIGSPNDQGLKAGQTFDAEINVDLATGQITLAIPLPDFSFRFQYSNFKELELFWSVHGIYKN